MSIPYRSFTGVSVLRSATVRLFGEAQPPPTAGGFACSAATALSFSWVGDTSNGEPIPLTFAANQVNSKTLVLPPRSLATFAVSRFVFRTCYAGNAEARLCGLAETAFVATVTPLVVALVGGNTTVGDGVVAIDASRSFDPDGEPGDTLFEWACDPPPEPLVGAAHPPIPNYLGCQSADGSPAPMGSQTDPVLRLRFLGAPRRGANYTLSVTLTKGDRIATASVWLVVVAKSLPPVISIERLPSEKINPGQKLTLRASVASDSPETLSTLWSVLSLPSSRAF